MKRIFKRNGDLYPLDPKTLFRVAAELGIMPRDISTKRLGRQVP